MESGALASAELARIYAGRLGACDATLHSTISVVQNAEAGGAALDAQRGAGALLQGAVILVKDNIDVAGFATTAGSQALAGNLVMVDAPVAARLRAAHGLILGKANLSEWANFRGYDSISGWSALGGQGRNGRNAGYTPCGSSSGSAAAVAAGLASAALGTETNGSVICPAAMNGLVGFKPTVGLVSRTGVVPISSVQDTVGPITRTVGDAARLLTVLAGPDAQDPATAAIPAGLGLDFEAGLPGATLAGKRLGVVLDPAAPAVVFNAQRARLMAAGATLVAVSLPGIDTFANDHYLALLYEFKVGLNAYLAGHPVAGQPTTLAELISFNTSHASTELIFFGQQVFFDAQATSDLTDPAYLAARASVRAASADAIAAALAADGLDALIAPTTTAPWPVQAGTRDQYTYGAFDWSAAAGYPHLTVPMGLDGGLPVGLSIFGAPWDDAKILALGHAFEQLPP